MILITGASGVVGRALVARLTAKGEPLRHPSSLNLDLRDRAKTIAFMRELGPRIVYHLAARVHGLGGNQRFPGEMYADNALINLNVIDGALAAGVEKIVAAGTVAIYSSNAPRPTTESDIWTGPPHASEAAYGHAKRGMLAQLQAYALQYGLRFAYPILTNVYGPHDRFDPIYGHVIPSLIAKFHAAARDGTAVTIWGTGVAERDFIHADDATAALDMLAGKFEGPINLATGKTVPIRRIVDLIAEISGVRDVEWDATYPDGQLERSYSVAELAALGFVPGVSLADGLASTYGWYAANVAQART